MIPSSTPTALLIALSPFPRPEPLPEIHNDWRFVAPGSSSKVRAAVTVRPGRAA